MHSKIDKIIISIILLLKYGKNIGVLRAFKTLFKRSLRGGGISTHKTNKSPTQEENKPHRGQRKNALYSGSDPRQKEKPPIGGLFPDLLYS